MIKYGNTVYIISKDGISDGTDTLVDIETLQFSDGSIAISGLPEFDAWSYLASYGDLINAFGADGAAATRHFVTNGFAEGRVPDVFDEWSYLASYGDLINAFGADGTAAAHHYVQWGFGEGRAVDNFDEWQYLASYGDLLNAFGADGAAATKHFVKHGYSEGRGRDAFDEASYMASLPAGTLTDLNGDGVIDGTDAAMHYIEEQGYVI